MSVVLGYSFTLTALVALTYADGNPSNVVAAVGDVQAVINCDVTGLTSPKWKKEGESSPIVDDRTPDDSNKHTVPATGDYSLTILNVALTDGGLYTCEGTASTKDGGGGEQQARSSTTSMSARLIVLDKPTCEVTDMEFKCEANFGGDWGPLADVTDKEGDAIGTNPGGTIGTAKMTRTQTVTAEQAGLVKCALKMETSQRPESTSGEGIDNTVPAVPDDIKYKCIEKGNPSNVVAAVGDAQALIPCNDDDLSDLKWEKGEAIIVDARAPTDKNKHSAPVDGGGYALTVLNVALSDGGLYTCKGTSSGGGGQQGKSTSVSKSARLIVLEKPTCTVNDKEFKCETKFGGDWGPLADVSDEDGEAIGTNPGGTIETDKMTRSQTITDEHGVVTCTLKMETSQRPTITAGEGIEDNVPGVPDDTKYQCTGRTSGGAQQTSHGSWLGFLIIILTTRWC